MSTGFASVLAAAESLTVEERRELIDLLLGGLDDGPLAENDSTPPVLTEVWRQEVNRRSAEYDAGTADTVSWQDVQARWQLRRAGNG